MTLEPFEYFTIVRQLADPFDSNTYYVRAVIRNARTDAIIDTVNLTDHGSQRFSREWQVPADTSGLGFFIIVTSTVYTNSGYSTVSDMYGYEANEYLVQERKPAFGGGGGGGIDYDKLRKIVQEIVAEAVGGIPKPERPEKVNLTGLMTAIQEVHKAISALPQPDKVEFAPLVEKMQTIEERIMGRIDQLPAPIPPEKVDFTPLYRGLQKMADMMATTQDVAAIKEEILRVMSQAVDDGMKKMSAFTPRISFEPIVQDAPEEDERLTRAKRLTSV